MAGVQVAVGVGRPVVEEESVIGGAVLALPVIKVVGASLDVLFPVLGKRSWSGRKDGDE